MPTPRTDWKTLDIKLRYLWKCGDTAHEIAETMGLSERAVATRASKIGLPRRWHWTGNPVDRPYAKDRRTAQAEHRA